MMLIVKIALGVALAPVAWAIIVSVSLLVALPFIAAREGWRRSEPLPRAIAAIVCLYLTACALESMGLFW